MSEGNGFIKMDFHVHTPISECYDSDFRRVTPQEIIDAAVEVGLGAFVVTDHNSAQSVGPLRDAAKAKGVIVFPGIEFTTPGGHVLSIFDPATPIATMNDLLRDVGIGPNQEGNPWEETKDWTVDVFEKIVQYGGIAVAAHIERAPRGFLEQVNDRSVRQKIHSSDNLGALEITVASWKSLWNDGKVAGYPKKYPVIQGSDAHAPKELARRPVYIRLLAPNLRALQFALAHHLTNLYFPNEFAELGK